VQTCNGEIFEGYQMAESVPARRNPTWTPDEVILACDLVAQNSWHQLEDSDPRVVELSTLLQGLPLHPLHTRLENFRNTNGVARKTADIATAHPDYRGVRTHGGATDRRAIAAFMADPAEMHVRAQALREAAMRGELANLDGSADREDDDGAAEGGLLVRLHVSRERSRGLRRRKIENARRNGQPIACEVCGFDFEQTYGNRGRGYIECHHIVPLHALGSRRTLLRDLALVCANCHRMIHVRSPWLTPKQLRAAIPPPNVRSS
jgi:5-methylcytosine-specific restriction enzyme A